MTDEKINVAIAESLGFIQCFGVDESEPSRYWENKMQNRVLELLPRYTTDLNAMHAVVMQATVAVRKQMRFWLYEMTDQMSAHDATARQRAEAYLRTIGKWEE